MRNSLEIKHEVYNRFLTAKLHME